MNLTAEVAIELSKLEKFHNYSDNMQNVYDNTDKNHKLNLGYGQIDIDFTKCFEEFKLSDREKDLLYISQFFHHAWKTLHLDLKMKFDNPSSYSLDVCYNVYARLQNYNLAYKLLKELSEKQFLKLLKKSGYVPK